MYNYKAYNLGIASALPLPELQASAEVAAVDVTIDLSLLNWSPAPESIREDELCFEVEREEAHFFWSKLGKFRVSRGAEILIDPCAEVEDRLLRLPLLGTILAVLLHQRGRLVLHASAVAIDGEAIIFVGNKGRGKSTMAASLYGRGHELIADDVVALEVDEAGRPMAIPGYPQFKLYPEAAVSSLGPDDGSLSQLADCYEKCGRRITDRFAKRSLPVRSIYVLGIGPSVKIEQLDPQAALLVLIANSYMARFGKQLLHGEEASSHLRKCTSLMNHVPVYRLERPNSLSLLPSIAQVIEEQGAPASQSPNQ